MNRQTIVERAVCALVVILGFALVYGLPMLGLSFAVDHGLYIAAAGSAAVSPLRADRLERVVDVLDYHLHDGRRHATVRFEELGGCPELKSCIPVDELHADDVTPNCEPARRDTPNL